MKLRILSYNVCHGMGIDGETNLARTIEEIRRIGADIVGLQEVDRHFGERSGWEDQTKRLAESLGMEAVFGSNLVLEPDPAYPGVPREYGTAILSRYPIVSSANHRLPQIIVPGAWNEVRGLLEAHIQLEGGLLRMFNTHLGLTEQERSAQVATILEVLQQTKGETAVTVMTGDFNSEPGSPELTRLHAHLQDAYGTAHAGQHANTFMKRVEGQPTAVACIDYIWCSGHCSILRADVQMTLTSDHLPLTAEIEF